MTKRLYRSKDDRMIWGVCGGLAQYFDIDPTIVRVIVLLSIFLGTLGIWAYIVLTIVVPLEGSENTEPKDTIKENVGEIKKTASELGRELRSTLEEDEHDVREATETRHHHRNILGIALIILGIIFLLSNFGLFWWFRWGILWPLVVLAIGVLIILSTKKRR